MRGTVIFLMALSTAVLRASLVQALTCDEVGLLCPGGHPIEVSYTILQRNVPSKDGSAYKWASSGTPMIGLTSNITCEERRDHLIIRSTGIPSAKVGKFPFTVDTDGNGHGDNPNTIGVQNFEWKIPRTPRIKTPAPPRLTPTNNQLPFGPIGFTLNGVAFFNPYNSQGKDAVDSTSSGYEVMDLCYGHPTGFNAYHHHYIKANDGCLFQDTPGKHSPKIGYAFDGIPIYGPLSWNGTKPTDLDACNGRNDPTLGYIYHTTDTASPYILGCYRYQVIRQRFNPGFDGDFRVFDNNPGVISTKCSGSQIGDGPQGGASSTQQSMTSSSSGPTTTQMQSSSRPTATQQSASEPAASQTKMATGTAMTGGQGAGSGAKTVSIITSHVLLAWLFIALLI